KVRDAVARLGYVRDTYAANLARQRQYSFVFLLPERSSQFADTLTGALREAVASQRAERVTIRIRHAPMHDPHAIVRALRALKTARLDGVAIMAPETPQVRDAVARLKEAGLAVVSLATDLPNAPRDYFIGINNIVAGRTAASLMGRFVGGGGRVLVATHSLRSRDSLERRLGFDEVMARDFPGATVSPTVESYDDPARMEAIVETVLAACPRLAGVYSMGSGNPALLSALRRSGRLRETAVIAHELTPTTRQALLDDEIDAVIAQNAGHLARSALRVLRGVCDGQPIYDAQERIRTEIILRENLP
ncbi:MAG: substrate-binding domain-containing protein, partial [Pseudomonadota bacterium]